MYKAKPTFHCALQVNNGFWRIKKAGLGAEGEEKAR
jgi:hypothetical protein